MKKLIGIITVLVLTTTLSSAQSCDIVISPQSTIHQIDSLMTMLKKQNIFLDFSKLEYSNGKLMKIKGSVAVNSPNGSPNATFSSENLEKYKIKVEGSPAKLSVSGK